MRLEVKEGYFGRKYRGMPCGLALEEEREDDSCSQASEVNQKEGRVRNEGGKSHPVGLAQRAEEKNTRAND